MRERILLVDGEHNRSRLLRKRLERQGYDVVAAGSVDEAVAANEPASVMLVDLTLLCGPDRGRLEQLIARSHAESGSRDAGAASGVATGSTAGQAGEQAAG